MTPWLKTTLITATICILCSLFVVLAWQIGALGDQGHLGALGAVALVAIGAFTGHLLQMLREPTVATQSPIVIVEKAMPEPPPLPREEKAPWDVESTSIIAPLQVKTHPESSALHQGVRIRSVGSLRSTRTPANDTMRLPTLASTS